MSDVQKTVEETPAVVPATEPVVETPATEATEAPKEAEATEPETTATPAVENSEAAEPVKEEIKPATEGTLGHKAPGLVKGFRFSKRFFYFNEEAVESKQLSVFHQNEKASVANPIAAWASQTGKGLLFFTKRAEDKATPAGIFNLSEVSDVTKEGSTEFLFKVAGQKHTFQASSAAERDSWVVALESKATEAKAEKETIITSEGYKAELEKLTKPAAAVAAKKPEEKKEETPAEAATEAPKEEAKEEKKEEKAATKSRSQSRKRTSIFGTLLGKKDAEEKKEEKAEAKEETPATEEAKAAEPTTETSVEAAPVAAEPVEAIVPAVAPVEATEEVKAAEPVAETPAVETEAAKETPKEEIKEEKKKDEKKSKRASIFGNFFQKVASPSQEKSEKEATAVPATEETAVASTAPQLENPVEETAAPVEATETAAPTEAAVETPVETPAETVSTPKEKRRTSFFGNLGVKKEKKAESSDNEATDGETKETKAKSNKLGGLFRKPSKAVKLDKEEVAAAETEAKADKAEEVAPAVPAKETAEEAAVPETTQTAPAEATEEAKNVTVHASTPVQAAA
ncbi:hypothetical protein MYU51_012807 [Penicillium brevicompactum]|uniref:uncharacterized protein n=1 Tax=Penicillium brevicompactum TaxID=5074 RepID=UPI002542157E|nr:uncharacterized protein N7506_011508 [Penicillium brevicompactum]KAJ5318804.1 hypothetical protein N7506_011508 [Penicillium brevicompactum]